MDGHLEKEMMLAGARIALNATDSARTCLAVEHSRLRFSSTDVRHACTLDLNGHLILPGLINSHDHLEFNLFPRLGRGPYASAAAWADDIYRPLDAPVRQHLQVPKSTRLLWGGIKNLVSGVTTVSHHNPYDAEVFDTAFPVRVVKRFGWAHSLRFCADVKERFRLTPPDAPFIVHAGEGTDSQAKDEVYSLDRAGILASSTVLVHGTAFQDQELELIQRRGASVVWCPSSNRFMLGATLSPAALDAAIPIALGTDSALTADGDLIDEVASARRHADPCRVYDMVTIDAARILRLTNGEGTLRDGGIADLVVIRDEGLRPADALSVLRPELVMVNGRVKLLSDEMANRLSTTDLSGFEPIEIEDRGHFLIDCRVSEAFNCAVQHLGADFRLAGKRVLI